MRTSLRTKFPANRENNREFCRIWRSTEILASDQRADSIAYSGIPCATEQGISKRVSGKIFQGTGNRYAISGAAARGPKPVLSNMPVASVHVRFRAQSGHTRPGGFGFFGRYRPKADMDGSLLLRCTVLTCYTNSAILGLGVSPHEATRVHHAVLGCSGRMASRGSRAAGGLCQ